MYSGADVGLREDLTLATPRLRRYARALATGASAPSEFADELVQATLLRALRSRPSGTPKDLIVRLYATLTQLHREACCGGLPHAGENAKPRLAAVTPHTTAVRASTSSALMALPSEEREAILLVVVEGFDHEAAARILRIARSVLVGRLAKGRDMLAVSLRTASSRPATARGAPHLRLVAG